MKKKLAIIGSGPAGLYLSYFLKDSNFDISLYESNKTLGKKLSLTGGGRMNITNKIFNYESFQSYQPNILKKIFKNPWFNKTEEILKELNIEYKWENNRAILKSENASQEINRVINTLKQHNINIINNYEITTIKKNKDNFILNNKDSFDIVVIATGGKLRFDNNNDTYILLKQLNHNITKTTPTLHPLYIKNNPFTELSGISIYAKLTDPISKKSFINDILFTHKGISGPLTLDYSSLQTSDAILNFLPNLSYQEMESFFLNTINHKVKPLTILNKYLPKKISLWHLNTSEISLNINIGEISKSKLNTLLNNIFTYKINNLQHLDYTQSWSTKGGLCLEEIDPQTFESKIHKKLYFCGEVLDIDGLCGGYNISFAIISGKIISESLMKSDLQSSNS